MAAESSVTVMDETLFAPFCFVWTMSPKAAMAVSVLRELAVVMKKKTKKPHTNIRRFCFLGVG